MLGVLLLVAQSLAVAHTYQHEFGSPVDKTCASCVIGGQLANVCADTAGDSRVHVDIVLHEVRAHSPFDTAIIPAANQRGPPE